MRQDETWMEGVTRDKVRRGEEGGLYWWEGIGVRCIKWFRVF